ncbi:hypothetical protein [Alkaliphilus transvaalensis]|uniref:hypothetical protein n=1 Tax=Alkaliphilus transvaalensis TaxID=114628 RepID=UPI000479311B|nr:hypothetical protein [Alkaliphilus transvaalensis]
MAFLTNYWIDILLGVIFVGGLLYFYKKSNEEVVKKIILALVIEAEKALGSGNGELKYAMVVERIYEVLPTTIRILVTKKQLDQYIEEAVAYLKNYLAEGNSIAGN